MPTTGFLNPKIYPPDAPSTTGETAGHRSRIDKRTEKASPGYYAADLINYDDWCVAQMAQSLGKTKEYKQFIKRAGNFANMFDPHTKYMRPKDKDGKWLEKFDPLHTGGYTEGNS
jgi:hypothetical protein